MIRQELVWTRQGFGLGVFCNVELRSVYFVLGKLNWKWWAR